MASLAVPDASRARAVLIVLTAVWGSTFVVIQTGVDLVSPLVLIAARFVVAGAALALFRPRAASAGVRLLGSALPMSIALLGGFALQTTGLQTTTPARSAFITSLSVIFVPVFDAFDTHRLPRWRLLLAAVISTVGIVALFHPIEGEWRRGDTLTLLGALLFAYYIVELDRRSRRHETGALVMAQSLTIAAGAGVLAIALELAGHPQRFTVSAASVSVIAYLGLVCTALTFWAMTWAQARVAAVEAAVIYTLEPVLAAALSVALGREPAAWHLAVGGAFVVLAMLVASTDPSVPHPIAPPEGID